MEKMNEIEVKNVSFTYPGDERNPPVRALDGVTLEIEKGSFTVILGHNGSGKSTLARIMCMIDSPEYGSVVIDGRAMTA